MMCTKGECHTDGLRIYVALPAEARDYRVPDPYRLLARALALGIVPAALALTTPGEAAAQQQQVYRGVPRLPDFQGQDRSFAAYRTRISEEVRTGPNSAWRYAIVEIGCGTGCRLAYVGDLTTGRVFEFPYGGEEFLTCATM